MKEEAWKGLRETIMEALQSRKVNLASELSALAMGKRITEPPLPRFVVIKLVCALFLFLFLN